MTLPLTLGLLAAWIILPALAIIALKGRTLFGDRADDLSSEGADEGGRVFHDQPISAEGKQDHVAS